jgi:hypothetical protein
MQAARACLQARFAGLAKILFWTMQKACYAIAGPTSGRQQDLQKTC